MTWQRLTNPKGRVYYLNHAAETSQWDAPEGIEFDSNGNQILKDNPVVNNVKSDIKGDAPPTYEEAIGQPGLDMSIDMSSTSSTPQPQYGYPPSQTSNYNQQGNPQSGYYNQYQTQPPYTGGPSPNMPVQQQPAYAPLPYSNQPYQQPNQPFTGPVLPVYPVIGMIPEVKKGLFGSISRLMKNLSGRSRDARTYTTSRQQTAVTLLEGPRQPLETHLEGKDCCSKSCLTCSHTPTVTTLSIITLAFLAGLIASIVIDSLPFMIVMIVLFSCMAVAYFITVLFVFFPSAPTGTACCGGCKNGMYRPVDEAISKPFETESNFAQTVINMDEAIPELFIQVLGYYNDSKLETELFEHNSFIDESHMRGIEYGFCHYFPVNIATSTNVSGNDVHSWFNSNSGYSSIRFTYDFNLSTEDRQWVTRMFAEYRKAYTGWESCKSINLSLVYCLPGVTPSTNVIDYSAVGERCSYDMFQRPGVNSTLYNWSKATFKHSTHKKINRRGQIETDYRLFKHSTGCGLRDWFFTRFTNFWFTVAFSYIWYVIIYRSCCTRERTFVHTKNLQLAQTMAPLQHDCFSPAMLPV